MYDQVMLSLTLTLSSKNRKIENRTRRKEKKSERRKYQSSPSAILTLPPLQSFFSEETDFHFCQFLSNFLRYSSSNFLSSHLYNTFAVNLPGSFPLLKSLFSAISILSCLLTSTFIYSSNSPNASFAFSKFSLLSQVLYSAVNLFHHTRYLSTPLIFLLFSIFSTSHSLIPFTSIGFPSSLFCPPTCSLYRTIQLMLTTG